MVGSAFPSRNRYDAKDKLKWYTRVVRSELAGHTIDVCPLVSPFVSKGKSFDSSVGLEPAATATGLQPEGRLATSDLQSMAFQMARTTDGVFP